MSDATAQLLLTCLAGYTACGGLFAALFCTRGAGRLAAAAGRSSWGFRMLLAPAATVLWPWLACRWAQAVAAHREPE